MKKRSAEDRGLESGALPQDEIEQAVARFTEAYRNLLLLFIRLVREDVGSRGTR
jgi:hypothetical protein